MIIDFNFGKTRKTLQISAWMIFVAALGALGFFFYKYFQIDVVKGIKYLNSKMFGSLINILILYVTIYLFDIAYPGNTIRTIMGITEESSLDDKKNATNFMCCIVLATAYLCTYN